MIINTKTGEEKMNKELLTKEETMILLNLDNISIRRYTKQNRIPHIRITNKKIMYPKNDILNMIKGNKLS